MYLLKKIYIQVELMQFTPVLFRGQLYVLSSCLFLTPMFNFSGLSLILCILYKF